MILRPYQDQAVRAVWQYFIQGGQGNPLIAMPTGTGKSLVIASLVESILKAYPGQHILMLTHVKELIEQNEKQLRRLYPAAPCGVFSAGLNRRELAPVTFAGIASVAKRALLFQNTDIVLIDEAHLVSPNNNTMYRRFLDELKSYNPNVKVIGLTATAYRLGQGSIVGPDELFTDFCIDQTTPEWFEYFINNGWLSPLVPKHMDNTLDTSDIRVRGGEFMAKDVATQLEEQRVTVGAFSEAVQVAADRKKWLVFANNIEHTEECQNILNMMGVSSLVVHSKMDSKERDANIEAFKRGEARAMINRDILTTGFDVPDIDCIVMLRPTQSPGLWVQMLGRGTRVSPDTGKQNCLVLDFAGNTARLGPIDQPVVPRKRGAGGGQAPVKVCPTCATYIRASATRCGHCGHEFPRDPTPKLTEEASSLALISSKDMPKIDVFEVQSMISELHQKAGKADAIRVLYYCGKNGIRRFSTYLSFEEDAHPFFVKKSREWWATHAHTDTELATDPPNSTAEAIAYFDQIFKPTHIRVWTNKKYPEVMAYDFSGTGFGTVESVGPSKVVGMLAQHREDAPVEERGGPRYETDEEIPF